MTSLFSPSLHWLLMYSFSKRRRSARPLLHDRRTSAVISPRGDGAQSPSGFCCTQFFLKAFYKYNSVDGLDLCQRKSPKH